MTPLAEADVEQAALSWPAAEALDKAGFVYRAELVWNHLAVPELHFNLVLELTLLQQRFGYPDALGTTD